VRLALDAGKHVLVEKPIARTLAETDEMIAAAGAAGRVLMVGEQFHFMPAFRHVRTLIARERLGRCGSSFDRPRFRPAHRLAPGSRRVGGGALIDGGIHYIHNLRWWGGPVRRLFALRPPSTVDMDGEDAITVLAELAGGA